MMRKSRLIKVIFASSAAIFIFLQFIESSITFKALSKELETPPGTGTVSRNVSKTTTKATTLLATTLMLKPSSSSSQKKDATVEAAGEQDTKEAQNSLGGERIHGLPNETNSGPRAVMSNSNISRILTRIKAINEDQSIRNEDLFGPVTNSTVIIAIQVHNRLQYLRQLIISLSQANGIDKTLLIFSHDFWDEAINDLVNSVDFAKTMQIFYPFSIQTHPNEFPGESPNDCPRNAKKDQALRLKCANAEWPDLYGHYREAKFTQTKHHWWWKANRIFDQLRATRDHDGLVLFLEEDHYVSEDFLPVLNRTEAEKVANCPNCDIICLGTYLKSYNYNRDHKTVSKHNSGVPGFVARPGARPVPARRVASSANFDLRGGGLARRLLWAPSAILSNVIEAFRKDYQLWPGGPIFARTQRVEIAPWESAKHNMGMAFNRALWRKIHGCREYFCNYDDYNWDWSLQHVSKDCFKSKLQVLLVKGPRVFHIGECGVHHKKVQCEAANVVKKVQDILVKAKSFLFPTDLKVVKAKPPNNKKQKNPKGNGGWGDHRDRALCMNMASLNRSLTAVPSSDVIVSNDLNATQRPGS